MSAPGADLSRVLSGESGLVEGPRRRARAHAAELLDGAASWFRLVPPRLRRAARRGERRNVYVTGVYRDANVDSMRAAVSELESTKHRLKFSLGSMSATAGGLEPHTALEGLDSGKFDNLNALLRARAHDEADWVLVIDDDVRLPAGFLDAFVFLAEHYEFQLAQPALTHTSHAAWSVCRRARWTLARTTRMVEIGPLTAFHSSLRDELLPFPSLRMGWGLDSHWGALALERGWRLGIVDATPVRHELGGVAESYDRTAAEAEAAAFLGGRAHIDRDTALSVVARHFSW